MNIRQFNIGTRLSLGFAVIIGLAIFVGIVALKNISSATKTTEDMYMHPLAVSNAVHSINADIIAIHRSMKDVALAQNERELLEAEHLVDEFEKKVYENFEVVFSQFLGDLDDAKKAYNSFLNWRPIREEVIYLWHQGKSAEAIAITKGKGAMHVSNVLADVKVMVDFANKKAETFYSNTKQKEKEAYNFMLWLLVLVVVLSSVIVFVISRSLIAPIKRLNVVANKIQLGDLSVRHQVKAKDEIGNLAVAFNKMADAVEARNKVLEGLSKISASMLGENEVLEFASSLLSKFIKLTKAQMATFYILDKDLNRYVPLESVGADINLLKSFEGNNPPGDFGKVIRSKKIYHLRNIPENTIFIYTSVIGEFIPKEVVTIPIIENDIVVALISCVSIHPFAKESLDIMYQAQPLIDASYCTLIANKRTREYSDKLEMSNQELEMQSEELKEQAEELQQQANELKISSDNLHEQNLELDMQRRQVEEANRLKSEFLSNMSHELRTPLNSINALSNVLIHQSAGKLDDEETNYLRIIERNGKRLLSLINDILDLSKVEAGKMEIQSRKFSLNSVLAVVQESVQPLADDKGIELTFSAKKEIQIESDESRLNQVFTNILGNAIKFTEKGSVEISCEKKDDKALIFVKDTGIGIDEELLPVIFQEFRQADGTTSRAYEGTGLGLAISNKIVKALNGSIKVESKLGTGTVFTIEIPLKSEVTIIENAEPFTAGLSSTGNKTILIVDDDKKFASEISEKLQEEGFSTITVYSGKDVVELAVKYRPYAITLDILMPEVDGWEVLQQLQQNPLTANIPAIIMSKSEDLDTSIALGAVGYIQKPIDKNLLINEIRKINRTAKKIVVVDDSEVDRMQLCKVLEKENLVSTIFENGEDCIRYLNTNVADVLIVDLMMPGMNGFQVIKEIRKNYQTINLPIIVVTAKDLSADEKEFLQGRAASVLTKGDNSETNVVNEIYRIINRLDGKKTSELNRSGKGEKNILMIEDNESAIIQVRKVLEAEGFGVHHVKKGKDALEFVKHTIPDGIILDLMMPEMDGFEVLEKIRASVATKNIPVLILTAKNLTKADLNKLSSNNVRQLIQKGDVNTNELIAKVRLMLDGEKKSDFISGRKLGKEKIANREKPKVLVVEDNPDNRITVRAILGDRYEIIEAEDGEIGILKTIEELPDLVLLDISLPKKDGFAVVKAIKENKETTNIPVIALTAKAMKGDREKIMDVGCNEYVSKPIDGEELLSKISKCLA
jgi:CheY-like chemotaxis protein/signal transduction histidine kinase/HAMP domain-containing protein